MGGSKKKEYIWQGRDGILDGRLQAASMTGIFGEKQAEHLQACGVVGVSEYQPAVATKK